MYYDEDRVPFDEPEQEILKNDTKQEHEQAES